MKKNIFIIIFVGLFFGSVAFSAELENLGTFKKELISYHDKGQYELDFEKAINDARSLLQQRISENTAINKQKKLALVLDIDDTSISTYKENVKNDFSYNDRMKYVFCYATNLPPIKPTLELYNFAKQNKVSVFFISGRKEHCRSNTMSLLNHAGYKKWDALYLRGNNDNGTAVNFKTKARQKVIAAGYDIAVNVGDQVSDLAGGSEDAAVKLPNPYYFVP